MPTEMSTEMSAEVVLPPDCPPIPEGFEPERVGWQILTPEGEVVEQGEAIVLKAVAVGGEPINPTEPQEG